MRPDPRVLVMTALLGCRAEAPEPGSGPVTSGPAPAPVASGPNAASAAHAPASAAPGVVTLTRRAMGTRVDLTAFPRGAVGEAAAREALELAMAEILRLEALMTTWRPDSDVSRVNAAAGGAPVEVSAETFEVVAKSLWIARASGGVFDVTFEAMRDLWRFDEDRVAAVPDPARVAAARKLVDFRRVVIDPERRTIGLRDPGMKMSLGGIAKGYAVDAAARVLEARGLTAFVIRAGGDLLVRGTKPDGPFRVGVRDPRSLDPESFFATLEVVDHAFSTAGDYERAFVKDGKRYHHILDPRTGAPATASRSVTIWAKDAFTADALDDAVFILGPEKGLALVESIDDAGAVIVDANNRVWVSRRLEGKLDVLRAPTDGP